MILSLLRRASIFAVCWWIAVEGNLAVWPLALVGIGGTATVSLMLLPPSRTPVISLPGLLFFAGFFIRQSLLGGVQVARLALQRRPRLDPVLIELPLDLPPGMPRLLFTATLGLMPGTLGVRLGTESLHVHVLDASLPIGREADILSGHIARLFGVSR